MKYIEDDDFNYWFERNSYILEKLVEKETKISYDIDFMYHRILSFYRETIDDFIFLTKNDYNILKEICNKYDEETIKSAIIICNNNSYKNKIKLRPSYILRYLDTLTQKEEEKILKLKKAKKISSKLVSNIEKETESNIKQNKIFQYFLKELKSGKTEKEIIKEILRKRKI